MTKRKFTAARRSVTLALTVAALGLLVACAPRASDVTQDSETVEVFVGNLEANATASGALAARRSATLQASTPARVTGAAVEVGQTVQKGDVLVTLDTTGLELNKAMAEQTVRQREALLGDLLANPTPAELVAAEAAVASAQAQLDDLKQGPTAAELAGYESSLASAAASLQSASAELISAQGQVTDADIKAAEAQLAAAQVQLAQAQEANQKNPNQETHEAMMSAEQALASAQSRLDDLRGGPDTSAAQSSVSAAAARSESSQADYDQLVAGPTAAQLTSAEAQLADALATLADLQAGPSEAEVAAAKAELEQAKLSLADAEAAVAEATITAPFDGVVAAVHVHPGEIATGPIVDLVDLTSLEVVLSVDEADIGELAAGQAATVTLQAWPDIPLESQVTSISPAAAADPSSGLVTYDVRLALPSSGPASLAGMTADATLLTAEKQDVLLVANKAILSDRTNGTYSVRRLNGDVVEEVPIVIGLRDREYTEVRSGLSAGDKVLTGSLPQETFDGPAGGGPFGGAN